MELTIVVQKAEPVAGAEGLTVLEEAGVIMVETEIQKEAGAVGITIARARHAQTSIFASAIPGS